MPDFPTIRPDAAGSGHWLKPPGADETPLPFSSSGKGGTIACSFPAQLHIYVPEATYPPPLQGVTVLNLSPRAARLHLFRVDAELMRILMKEIRHARLMLSPDHQSSSLQGRIVSVGEHNEQGTQLILSLSDPGRDQTAAVAEFVALAAKHPRERERVDRRTDPRIVCSYPATLDLIAPPVEPNFPNLFQVEIAEISNTGARLRFADSDRDETFWRLRRRLQVAGPNPVPLEARVSIRLGGRDLVVDGRLAWFACRHSERKGSSTLEAGLDFSTFPAEEDDGE